MKGLKMTLEQTILASAMILALIGVGCVVIATMVDDWVAEKRKRNDRPD